MGSRRWAPGVFAFAALSVPASGQVTCGDWSSLGDRSDGDVGAMIVFDGGTLPLPGHSGPALYVGGRFTTTPDGTAASGVARWNGTAWSPLGLGTAGQVHAMAIYDSGRGDELVVGGDLTMAGGAPT